MLNIHTKSSKLKSRPIQIAVCGLLASMLSGCMKTVKMGDPALRQFKDMYSIPREEYGFTPIPTKGYVSIEGSSKHGGYDAMLHFYGSPSRTIAFRKVGNEYRWLGEQETFEGPRIYKTPDGDFHEEITITFYREKGFGEFQGLTIDYNGPDETLMRPRPNSNFSLSLEEVEPLLKAWGYRY